MSRRQSGPKIPKSVLEGDPIAVLKDAHGKLKQAETLRQQRQLDQAEQICVTLLKEFPDYYGALHTLGLVHGDRQDHALAIVYLVQAAMLNPTSWTTLTALAGEYLLIGAKEMASRTLRDALEINGTQPEIHVMLAEVYYEEREYVLAMEACKKALKLDPDMVAALQSLAGACAALGRYAEARDALDRLIKLKGPTLGVLGYYAQLPTALIKRDLIADLGKVVAEPGADKAKDAIDDAFVRVVALDKLQRHQDAWNWAVKANTMVLPQALEEQAQDIQTVEKRADWLGKSLSKFKGKRNSDTAYPTSLFILGLSRSGKTTAESIISSQADVFRGYENPAIQRAITNGYQNGALISFKSIGQLPLQLYPIVRDFYKGLVDELIGANKIFTNTTPGHIWDAPIVFNAIPNTKFVFIKRDFHDLVLRIFMKHYRTGNTYSYDLSAIKRYVTAYNKMMDLMLQAFPEDSIALQYEDMVADPGKALEQMCTLCGLKPDASLMPDVPNDAGCSEPYRGLIDAGLARA
jgi:Flp pilus assembly protein TadD